MKTEPEFKIGDTVQMKPEQAMICPTAAHGPFILDACDMQDIERGFIRRFLKSRYEIVKEKPMVDFTKPVTTRDGRKVRILCTDIKGREHVVIGLVDSGVEEDTYTWYKSGVYGGIGTSQLDLINPPMKKYLNLYRSGAGPKYYDTFEEAEKRGKVISSYIKTIEVEL